MTSIKLEASNLKVKYQNFTALNLEELSLTGKVFAILGHNGAGKSTFLKTLLELLPIEEGYLAAFDSRDKKLAASSDMAFCPENGAVFEDIPVIDYLKIWLGMKGLPSNLKLPKTAELIELFEIGPLLNKFGRQLSKGQRRRVQSVVGFLIDPKLFLFDEPFDGLDVQKTADLSNILDNFKNNTSFLISSHRMDVIERVADVGLVLADGKLIAAGDIPSVSKALAGERYIIQSNLALDRSTLDKIQSNFNVFISQIGEEYYMTGSQIDVSEIKNFLQRVFRTEANIKNVAPSLTDAMSLHLRLRKS